MAGRGVRALPRQKQKKEAVLGLGMPHSLSQGSPCRPQDRSAHHSEPSKTSQLPAPPHTLRGSLLALPGGHSE